ncbi:hypothetical protein FRB96_009683 [Tulasnella sp. 330]|nr:hypothetical protein FRB96_009683 [Tulasnella sp. 330]KAG8883317.1 hypothetical protein FRB97_006881 [Tulasnella sp. 331]KAG8888698.1 hypothetical protein FRB98_007064 [Tulasnella sp. 332]
MSPALIAKHDARGFSTRLVHEGSSPDATTNAIIQPLFHSATFKQDAVGVHKGYEYSRAGNPNRDSLEQMLASVEAGGSECVAFSSGSAATAVTIQSLGPNAHIICMNVVYGGTYRYMTKVAFENQGLETTFLDLTHATDDEISEAMKDNTKLIWIETPTNPTLSLVDVPKIVSLARMHSSNPLVLVDNTFLSPYFSSPLLQGADIVLHSLTKYINGHSDLIMGAVVFPPHHTLHAQKLRFLQNAIGAVPSPHDCWLACRGAKTLQLRMRAHGENAFALAKFLETSPHVQSVTYPGLASHPLHSLARRSLSPHAKKWVESLGDSVEQGGIPYGGMVSFRIRGDDSIAERFLTSTKLFVLAESLGGVESLCELPARMTHASIPEAERQAIGITEDLIRLSVGVEDADDLIDDVRQALEYAVEEAKVPNPKRVSLKQPTTL